MHRDEWLRAHTQHTQPQSNDTSSTTLPIPSITTSSAHSDKLKWQPTVEPSSSGNALLLVGSGLVQELARVTEAARSGEEVATDALASSTATTTAASTATATAARASAASIRVRIVREAAARAELALARVAELEADLLCLSGSGAASGTAVAVGDTGVAVDVPTAIAEAASAGALPVEALQAIFVAALGLTGLTGLAVLAWLTRGALLADTGCTLRRIILGLGLAGQIQVVAVAASIAVLARLLVAELEANLGLFAAAGQSLLAVVDEAAVAAI